MIFCEIVGVWLRGVFLSTKFTKSVLFFLLRTGPKLESYKFPNIPTRAEILNSNAKKAIKQTWWG